MSKPFLGLVESLFQNIAGYVEDGISLMKLKVADAVSAIVSKIIKAVILFVVIFIFFVVLNIGLALLISDLIGKSYAGFLILALVYALLCVVLFMRKGGFFRSMIAGMLIRKLFKHADQSDKK